jgi:hypothetical protein
MEHGGGVVSARDMSSGRLYMPDGFPLRGHGPEAGHQVQGPQHSRPWQWGTATPRLAPMCVPASRARGGGCLAAAFCLEPQYSGARMPGQARAPRHMHAAARASACAGRRAGCRHVGSAPERGQAKFEPVNAALTKANSRFLNCAAKMLDTKVVDETSFYNICKG